MTNPLHVQILTLFPDLFPGPLGASVVGRGLEQGQWSLDVRNIRDVATNKHKTVDDTPYGGGAGMVLRADILSKALQALPRQDGRVIYLSPRGKTLTQSLVRDLAAEPCLTLIAGRYEGVDQRVLDAHDVEEISIGDYVLAGGEVATMVLIEACVRTLPDVLGNADTLDEESFTSGLLEYPQYTRPAEWTAPDGTTYGVPEILTGGHHANIQEWRREQAETLTQQRRPDLWEAYTQEKNKR